ncbi:hypothetical protein L3X38_004683 [Prunus dulcis]|uniref:Retrotransposon Copia-like N-terminal domain-containing protein n=1 Tax=Prunus dulcis TaxID=3755 RepID=A0AAD4ZPH3_PRUDU|nr:hypothetical protein L3X38_004683 [Prunus dulcis]
MSIPYGVKLNGTNCTLWSQVVTMFIASRVKMGYLSGTIPGPAHDTVTYDKWVMENAIVKGWLIGAMEPSAIWLELDHRKPITFTQADVIKVRHKEIDVKRVYLFLIGLDDIYDPIRGEILHTEPFPNLAIAFATVRREEQRCNTMLNLVLAILWSCDFRRTDAQNDGIAIKSEGPLRAVTTALAKRREKPQFVGTPCCRHISYGVCYLYSF